MKLLSAPNSPQLLSVSHRTHLVVPPHHSSLLTIPASPLQRTGSPEGERRRMVLEDSTLSLGIPPTSSPVIPPPTRVPSRLSLGLVSWAFPVLVVICFHGSVIPVEAVKLSELDIVKKGTESAAIVRDEVVVGLPAPLTPGDERLVTFVRSPKFQDYCTLGRQENETPTQAVARCVASVRSLEFQDDDLDFSVLERQGTTASEFTPRLVPLVQSVRFQGSDVLERQKTTDAEIILALAVEEQRQKQQIREATNDIPSLLAALTVEEERQKQQIRETTNDFSSLLADIHNRRADPTNVISKAVAPAVDAAVNEWLTARSDLLAVQISKDPMFSWNSFRWMKRINPSDLELPTDFYGVRADDVLSRFAKADWFIDRFSKIHLPKESRLMEALPGVVTRLTGGFDGVQHEYAQGQILARLYRGQVLAAITQLCEIVVDYYKTYGWFDNLIGGHALFAEEQLARVKQAQANIAIFNRGVLDISQHPETITAPTAAVLVVPSLLPPPHLPPTDADVPRYRASIAKWLAYCIVTGQQHSSLAIKSESDSVSEGLILELEFLNVVESFAFRFSRYEIHGGMEEMLENPFRFLQSGTSLLNFSLRSLAALSLKLGAEAIKIGDLKSLKTATAVLSQLPSSDKRPNPACVGDGGIEEMLENPFRFLSGTSLLNLSLRSLAALALKVAAEAIVSMVWG
eukprot:GHVQ01038191.1.p1 GENE.GHVQ01038191.1~~GHVQ01038191.1.p1  ORF type:complete len:688 (+),score=73.99 GHVQ01038191.1:63-2126(+)